MEENRILRMTSKTYAQIEERVKELRTTDFFGFQSVDLMAYLHWEQVQPFLKTSASESIWRSQYPLDTPPLLAAQKYMPHAWKWANTRRSLMVLRAMEHMQAWFWLAGYGKELLAYFQEFDNYGKPQLVLASLLCEFNWEQADDGIWTSLEGGRLLTNVEIDDRVKTIQTVAEIYLEKETTT